MKPGRVPENADRDFTAGAFLVRDGEILLLKHTKLDSWMQPGGHVEEGETPDEAAMRELREETGHRARFLSEGEKVSEESFDLPEPFNVNLHRIREGHWHLDFQYLMKPEGREEDYEYRDENIDWFSPEELERLDMPENARKTCLKAVKLVD